MAIFNKYSSSFILLVLVFCLDLTGQTEIILNSETTHQQIGKQTFFLEDSSLNLTIQDVLIEDQKGHFKANSQKNINFSSTASAYWLKFKIAKLIEDDFYLDVGSAYIDSISLYEFNEEGELISSRFTGDDLPFSSREIEIGNYLFKLNLDTGTTSTYYLKVKSDQPLFFPLCVGKLSNFIAYVHDLDFLQGIYFGCMFLIFLYNLFLYISIREKIYLYYILYVASITWFMASVYGYFFEYFWPNSPFFNQIVVVSSGLTMVTATLFTQKFLNTKKTGSRLHKGLLFFRAIGVLVCLLVIFNLKILGLKLAQAGLLLMAIYFLIIGIRFKIKGYGPAKYYLIAWGSLIVGIFFAILESLNLIPVMPYLNAMQIGSALEVVLLSFALGDRINMYKIQKEKAQALALLAAKENEKLIKEQNTLLEKKVEERTVMLAIRNKELVELNREKDTLVSIVAHDLRTPLGIIKSLVQLFNMTPTKLTDDQETYLLEIENSSSRLLEMTDRILNLHTIENKKLKLNYEVVNLVDIVKYVVKSFKIPSTKKSINITIKNEKDSHFSEVDKNCLIQVLENLISNAIKFSEKGNNVTVWVKSKSKKTYIIVEDNGPGISKADQKKLFGKFQKLSARPTDGESSTGLGLSIVKKYVEAMRGKIHCKSELGKKTQFIIEFEEASNNLTKAN